ncbi:MAG: SRPBCC domain-containing protein [Deltaproteobacteria bacterium]|nr:SRPBCC domain-containing protein [Deltaproteobacteria bacterium]
MHSRVDAIENVWGSKEPVAEREVRIVRELGATPPQAFTAYARPEHLKRWFGPVGWPVTTCEMDFRVGGRFRFQMTGPAGEQGPPFGGEYLEIEPGKRIVYANGFFEPGSETMVVSVTLEQTAKGCRLTLHTLFQSGAMRRFHVDQGFVEGTRSGIDQLAVLAPTL